MAASAAQLLDELMGRDRNLAPTDQKSEVHWDDQEICKYYLCGFCPHELFVNTRADLGQCPKVHDDILRKEYEKSHRFKKCGYEDDFMRFLQSLISDVEKRIRRGHQRLALNATQGTPNGNFPAAKEDKIDMLTEKINELVNQAEELGCDGKVEESQGVMKLCEQLREERRQLETNAGGPQWADPEKTLEVCNVCSAFLVVGDAQQRIDEHLYGRQHTGYARIRAYVDDKQKKVREEADEREAQELKLVKEREDREKEREKEREERRQKDKEKEKEREERRKEREKKRKDRSRSKSRGRRSPSREKSDRSRDRRKSSSRERRRRSRSKSRHRRNSKSRDNQRSNRAARSTSRSRKRSTSRSHNRRSKSRERDTKRRSRSRDRDTKRRSRSRDKDSKRRSRSRDRRSRDNSKRSDDRKDGRSRSRDKDRSSPRERRSKSNEDKAHEDKPSESDDKPAAPEENHHTSAGEEGKSIEDNGEVNEEKDTPQLNEPSENNMDVVADESAATGDAKMDE